MSNLEEHAKRELELAGLFDKGSDYNGMIGKEVMKLVNTFKKAGHSGFSAQLTLQIFDKVARFKPLTAITDNPEEWLDISEMSGKSLWQNTRSPSLFSEDYGKTWYDVEKE